MVGRVHIKIFLRYGERVMRRQKTCEQSPGPVVANGTPFRQPVAGQFADLSVVLGVAGISGARLGGKSGLVRRSWVQIRQRITDCRRDGPNAFLDVHRDMLAVETKRVFFAAIMQLADGFYLVAGSLQLVSPAVDAPVIGDRIVPISHPMGVVSGLKGRPRRNTDRAICVSVCKTRTTRGQRIEVWRFDQLMAGTSQHVPIMFVRHNDEDICLPHPLSPTSAPKSAVNLCPYGSFWRQ